MSRFITSTTWNTDELVKKWISGHYDPEDEKDFFFFFRPISTTQNPNINVSTVIGW